MALSPALRRLFPAALITIAFAAFAAPSASASANFGFIAQYGSSGTGEGQFSGPTGVATDAAGNVYVADQNSQRLQKFSATGAFVWMVGKGVGGTGVDFCTSGCQSGSTGTAEGEFNRPWGVGTDPGGNVYVADQSNNRIQKFSPGGGFIWMDGKDVGGAGVNHCTSGCGTGGSGAGDGEFSNPRGLAVNPSGLVYVVNEFNNRIDRFTGDGAFLGTQGKDVGGSGIDTCTSGCLQGTSDPGDGHFNDPIGIGTDSGGSFYVADRGNARLEKFSPMGAFAWTRGKDVGGSGVDFCTSGCGAGTVAAGDGEFSNPRGVGADPSGDVYVSDNNNERLEKFSSTGDFLWAQGKNVGGSGVDFCTSGCQAGAVGSGPGQFGGPNGVASDCRSNVYVADKDFDRFQKFGDPASPPPPCTGPAAANPGSPPLPAARTPLTPPPPPCGDTRKFKFVLHHARTAKITKVDLFVNGRRRLHRTGRNIRTITLARLPLQNFTVKIVALQSTGSKLTSVRRYLNCRKTRPRTRGHHARHHRH